MHALEALNLDAAKDGGAANYDRLYRAIGARDVPGLVDVPAEDAHAFHRDSPPFRNNDLSAAEYRRGIDDCSIAVHLGAGEIDIETDVKGNDVSHFGIRDVNQRIHSAAVRDRNQ